MTREEWDAKQNASKKQFKYVSEGNPGQVKKVEVTEEETKEPVTDDEKGETVSDAIKQDWNAYLSWLDKKGMRGKPELDKGGVGNNLFKQYLKENPNTSLSEKIIPSIRKAYVDLRNDRLKEIESGKGNYEGSPESFMKHIVLNEQSGDPNYVGQHLTQTMFPGAKLTSPTGVVKKVELLGKGGTKVSAETLNTMK
jgi:hypothetical protein